MSPVTFRTKLTGACFTHNVEWEVGYPASLKLQTPGCPACAMEKRAGTDHILETKQATELREILRKRGYARATPQANGLIEDIIKWVGK